MTYIIFHRSDLDGRTSCAVVASVIEDGVELVPYDYSEPEIVERLYATIQPEDQVVIVDISIKDLLYDLVIANQEVTTVIDHHPVSLELPDTVKGLRNTQYSAAALTYMFYYDKSFSEIPLGVQLVSYWDTHEDSIRMWNDVLHFYLHAQTTVFGELQFNPQSEFFTNLLKSNISFIYKCLESGRLLEPYVQMEAKQVTEHSILAMLKSGIEGSEKDYSALILLGTDFSLVGNYLQDSFVESFDFIFTVNGNSSELYTKVFSTKLLARTFAESLGGGGHEKTGGFLSNGFELTEIDCVTYIEFK